MSNNHPSQNQTKPEPVQDPYLARNTGWGSMRSTTMFRAINFELFVKPNKVVMAFGLLSITGCVSYMVYMNMTDEKKKSTYVTLDEDGGMTTRQRTSRWY